MGGGRVDAGNPGPDGLPGAAELARVVRAGTGLAPGDEGRRGRAPWGLEVVAEHFPFDLFQVDNVPGLAFGGCDVH